MPAGIPKICLAESANGKSNKTIRKGNKNALEGCLFIYGPNEREREPEKGKGRIWGYIYDIIYM